MGKKVKERGLKRSLWLATEPIRKSYQRYRNEARKIAERKTRRIRTTLRQPAEYAVFFDTNVFGVLLRRGQPVETSFLWPFLGTHGWAKNKDLFHFSSTPFLVFEYLWIKIPQPPKFDFKAKGLEAGPIDDAIKAVYEDALDFYWREPTTNLGHIFTTYQEQKKRVPQALQPLFHTLIGNYLTSSNEHAIRAHLAYDIAAKTLYPESLRQASHIKYVSEMINRLQHGLNTSGFRKVSEMAQHLARKDDWHLSKAEKEEILREVPLKDHSDYVDTEVAAISTLGWHIPNGAHVSAHIFTCDRPEEVEVRATAAKAASGFAYWVAKRIAGIDPNNLMKPKQGFIHCLEPKTLNLVKSFNVAWF